MVALVRKLTIACVAALIASACCLIDETQGFAPVDQKRKVVIVGAGPAGLLFAHYLLRRSNYEVHLVEKRLDPRTVPPSELRTYPISLQQKRGIRALQEIPGLFESVEAVGGWMKGVYFRTGDRYSTSKIFKSPMLSMDRNQLTLVLLQHLLEVKPAENTSIAFHFNTRLEDVDLEKQTIAVGKGNKSALSKMNFDVLVAADGSRSAVRQALTDKGILSSVVTNIPVDARSLTLPRRCPEGSFQVEEARFNGWTLAGGVNALALPLTDDSCTGVMSFPQSHDPFENMTTAEEVLAFFQQSAPESLARLVSKEEAESLLHRPISRLYSVQCDQLHVHDKVLLLGDAAHATSNMLGQGANSALQDVQFFIALLDRFQGDWSKALSAWTEERLPCIQAVQEMSEYTSPPTPRMQREFRLRQRLRNIFPDWLGPLLVGYDSMQLLADTDLSYSEVLKKTRWWSDRVKKARLSQQSPRLG